MKIMSIVPKRDSKTKVLASHKREMHQPLRAMLELRIRNSIRYPLASIEDIKNYIKKYGDHIKCPECFKAKVERVPALEHDVEDETEKFYSPGAVWYVDDKGPYHKAIGGER